MIKMCDKTYCLLSKIVAALATAGLFYLTGSLWSFLCLLMSAYMDRELKGQDEKPQGDTND